MDKNILATITLPNGTILKNRAVMSPMTTCSAFYNGEVTSDLIEYYRARSGEVSAIIVESAFIDKIGLAFPGAIGIDDDNKIDGLSKIVKAIKEKGSKAIIQIYHGGRMVDPKLIGGQMPVGASSLAAPRPNMPIPEELTGQQVEELIVKFKDAFIRAIKAGFDGIEIHGANTYLIQQFFSPNSNQRNDKWGGDLEKRASFALSILEQAHKVRIQENKLDFIIGYRFSPEELEEPGIRFADSIYLLEQLAKQGLDYIHFSMGDTLRPSIVNQDDTTPLIDKYIKVRSENLAKIPVIGVGGIVNVQDIQQSLEHGYDLLAIGKAMIAFPDWLERVSKNEMITLKMRDRESLKIPQPLWELPMLKDFIIK